MRKICTAGEVVEFAFNKPAIEYRVKNFTDGDILVTHEEVGFVEADASKIKSMHGEDFNINEFESQRKPLTVRVKAEQTGEVEVSLVTF